MTGFRGISAMFVVRGRAEFEQSGTAGPSPQPFPVPAFPAVSKVCRERLTYGFSGQNCPSVHSHSQARREWTNHLILR